MSERISPLEGMARRITSRGDWEGGREHCQGRGRVRDLDERELKGRDE